MGGREPMSGADDSEHHRGAREGASDLSDWASALENYNARTAKAASGKEYCEKYADRIIERAGNRTRHVGIEIKLK